MSFIIQDEENVVVPNHNIELGMISNMTITQGDRSIIRDTLKATVGSPSWGVEINQGIPIPTIIPTRKVDFHDIPLTVRDFHDGLRPYFNSINMGNEEVQDNMMLSVMQVLFDNLSRSLRMEYSHHLTHDTTSEVIATLRMDNTREVFRVMMGQVIPMLDELTNIFGSRLYSSTAMIKEYSVTGFVLEFS